MAEFLWKNEILKGKVYAHGKTLIFQYNKSAILLENNIKSISSKIKKRINIIYLFVKYFHKIGEFEIDHCPTDNMTDDSFTKPQ